MSKFVLCCVSTTAIKEEFHRELTALLNRHHAQTEKHIHLSEVGLWALDMPVIFSDPSDAKNIKFELIDLSNKYQVDMALLPDHPSRTNRKLIVFDMDATLIKQEVINELADANNVGDKVKEITVRAMNGDMTFDESLKTRVSFLKGLHRSKMEGILARLELNPGVAKLIKEVQKQGYKTAIISGGFKYFAESFRERLKIDYAFANDLEWDGDVLTGRVSGPVVNAEEKARLLKVLAEKENLTIDQVVAVGDGANDIPMLLTAGFGIAFHAKEKVKKAANHQMGHGPMSIILYFLGIPGDHSDEAV